MNLFGIQEQQYSFPYHYLPSFLEKGISRKKELLWGGGIFKLLEICEGQDPRGWL